MNIQKFNFNDNQVRTITKDNDNPLFVAKDVAKALGYSRTTDAIKQHCKGAVKHRPIQDNLGREQKVRVIYEPDVYRLIFGSKLKSAIKFQDWVFEEVLPSIRKTGKYEINTLTPAQQRKIQQIVAHRCKTDSTAYQTIYRNIKDKFEVGSYKDVLQSDFNNLVEYLGGDIEVKQTRINYKSNYDNVVDKYTVNYLTSNDCKLDKFFKDMSENKEYRKLAFELGKDWQSAKIFLRILKGDIQKMFALANHITSIEEQMTKAIYSHELVGIA